MKEEKEEERYTIELIKEIKQSNKRLFIAFVITIALLFLSNMAWLIAWTLPSEETSETTEISQDGTGENNFIGNDGDIDNEPNN